MAYNASETEQKWQKKWEEDGLYTTDFTDPSRPKFYNLVMFPYPSGDRLHIGHWFNYGGADIFARFMRMKGHNVFEPMGYDSFGLPAENYAIKTGVPPQESTENNIASMTVQLKKMGTMYDWDKMVVTSRPEYYRWTQWVFLQLYRKGLAYKKEAPVNWCPGCQTVLANEQVQDGVCERCGSEVVKKFLNQWFLRITDYAEDLLQHDGLLWPENTILMQKNWIGKSTGSEIVFQIDGQSESFRVFTTRIDTLFGCTYAVLAPEHELVMQITSNQERASVQRYVQEAVNKSDIDRTAEGREKTGVFTGAYAINPANGEKVPVWVADYVLGHYGTGAVMAVPAHDERDFEFAKRHALPLRIVVVPAEGAPALEGAFTDDGVLIKSGEFDGMSSEKARTALTEKLATEEKAEFRVNYRLRDWLISRQRYWGAPIPIVYCEKCGEVPVPESELPVVLPIKGVDFQPRGKSPLASVPEFVSTPCPSCGGRGEREVDTMDTFMCSSWYFLRYLNPHDTARAFDPEMVTQWMPVDMYIGGPEHACMHLLYARFIHKVLMDDRSAEPFKRLVHQGLITKSGAKMSKSRGNVVSPDEFVTRYGSDVFRMYLMFMGPFTDGGDWSDKGITGIARFVERFWRLISEETGAYGTASASESERRLHRLIKKVGDDLSVFHFNTAIAALMEFVNFALKEGVDVHIKRTLAQLIAPLAPHLAEECFAYLGESESVFHERWPSFDPALLEESQVTLGVQVNGKVRGEITIAKDASQEDALLAARTQENVMRHLSEGTVVKEVYVPGKIIGFVVK